VHQQRLRACAHQSMGLRQARVSRRQRAQRAWSIDVMARSVDERRVPLHLPEAGGLLPRRVGEDHDGRGWPFPRA
jgi:hypothetical protein